MSFTRSSATDPWYPLLVLLDDANIPGDTPEEQVRNLITENARLERQLTAASRQTDYERLLATLDEDRSQTLLLLHDACIDAQRDQEAQGWGWLATHHRWPVRFRTYWIWLGFDDKPEDWPGLACWLPPDLVKAMRASPTDSRIIAGEELHYPSVRAALQAVVDVIAEGKWTVDGKPAKPTPQGTFLPYRE